MTATITWSAEIHLPRHYRNKRAGRNPTDCITFTAK